MSSSHQSSPSGSSPLPKPTIQTVERWLANQLFQAQIESPAGSNNNFLPIATLEGHVLSTVNVRMFLVAQGIPEGAELENYAKRISAECRKLLALFLVGSFKPIGPRLIELVEKGITDKDFAFHRYPPGSTNSFMLCSERHVKSGAHPCAVEVMTDWERQEIKEFCRLQWAVQAPLFRKKDRVDGSARHYEFDQCVLLPLMDSYENVSSYSHQGGYSQVWPVRMAQGHQDLYLPAGLKGPQPLLAVKRLFSKDPKDFQQETDMLVALTRRNHKGLVELLATYKHGTQYHMLFPYAKANLRSLWTAILIPYWNFETYFWVLDQMTNLAAALNAIHEYETNLAFDKDKGNPGYTRFNAAHMPQINVVKGQEKYGRHGDLKPENILWRDDSHLSHSPAGILQITDLGLGRFHHLDSRSRVAPDKLAGSHTYMPPEPILGHMVSRKYDMWSLGCIFLEFLVWLIEGVNGLERFNDSRMQESHDRVVDDTYFTVITDAYGRPSGAEVRKQVTKIMESLQTGPRCSLALKRVLHLLEHNLLVIKPDDRIDAFKLYAELREVLHTSFRDHTYLVGTHPSDQGKGVKLPKLDNELK